MKRLSIITGMFVMAIVAVSCQDGTMKQAKDLEGTVYKGITPCADCSGIAYTLSFERDGKYRSSQMYIGESNHRFIETGTYQIKPDSLLVLQPKEGNRRQFKIEENRLAMLDQDGEVVTGALASNYVLHKVDSTKKQNPWKDKRKKGIDFRASGNEPFWGLDVSLGETITFYVMDGDSVSVPISMMKRDTSSQVRFWQAKTDAGSLKVSIAPVGCIDSMSGKTFDYAVKANLNGQEFKGCGGFINPKARLNEFWTLHSLKDSVITQTKKGMKPPSLHFNLAKQKVNGFTGCNWLNGSFKIENGQVSFSKLATTKRACLNSNKIESRFLKTLKQVESYKISNARLYFIGSSDTLMVFQHSG